MPNTISPTEFGNITTTTTMYTAENIEARAASIASVGTQTDMTSFGDVYFVSSDLSDSTNIYTLIQAQLTGITLVDGDIVINKIKVPVNDTSPTTDFVETKCGYYRKDGTMIAFEGNVNAENVVLTNDITCAGDYDIVGNVKMGSKINATGMTISKFFEKIFTQELNPKITQPSVSSLAGNNISTEVGQGVATVNYSAAFNAGTYQYGSAQHPGTNQTTGATVTKWTLSATANVGGYSASATSSTSSSSFSGTLSTLTNAQAVPDMVITYNVSAEHGQGDIPFTNLSNEYAAGRVQAGTVTRTATNTIRTYRKSFWGTKTSAINPNTDFPTNNPATTNTTVRGLGNSSLNNSNPPTNFTAPDGTQSIVFALPDGTRNSMTAVNTSAMNAPVAFTKIENVMVNGANSLYPKAYDIWYTVFDAPIKDAAALSLSWA